MGAPMQSDMKVPSRPAPPLPNCQNAIKTRSHTIDLLSLGNDPFSNQAENLYSEGKKHGMKKKPPPRPPPPKYRPTNGNKGSSNLLDMFGRTKDSSRSKAAATAIVKPLPPVCGNEIPTDSLIDLHSPSISPTFTKSSSGVSVNSIGSLTIQSHSNSSSQLESGFEDDFISSSATTPSNDPFSDGLDPYSPTTKVPQQPYFELSNDDPKAKYQLKKNAVLNSGINKPTIIRVKPKPLRPPPPASKVNQIEKSLAPSMMTPVKQERFMENEFISSPPMPTVPPPPPPPEVVQTLLVGPAIPPRPTLQEPKEKKQPYCLAEYTYEATHPDDLSFVEGDKISLISKVNEEWLKGRISGKEGIFPANYVKIVVPLDNAEIPELNMTVIVLFPFIAETWDDLNLQEGEEIKVIKRINENWLYGECNGRRGQFPENFVQDITPLISDCL